MIEPDKCLDRFIVVAYTAIGAHIGLQSFAGITAEGDASSHFEALKDRKDAQEVCCAKLNIRRWHTVTSLQRTSDGGWVPIVRIA